MSRNSRRAVAAIIAAMAVPAGLLATGAAADAAAAHTGATKIEVCGTGRALTRPHSITLTCADHGELATHLHWTSWTAARATAVGEVSWKTATAAVPFASSRHWDHASAWITLTRPVAEADGQVLFTGARLHVTGHTPRGFLRNLTFDEGPAMAAAQAPSSGPAPRSEKLAIAASSGTLAYSDIEGFWFDAGGPASVEETAAAISDAESYDGSPGAIEPDVAYDVTGWGLWQITPGDSESQYGEDYQLLDPWNNAEAAVAKYNGAGGFSPWTTYTDGAYESYLQSVTQATGLADPGQYDPINSAPSGTHNSSDPGSTYGPAMPSIALINRGSGKCMSNGGSTANSAPITQYTCNGSTHQQWYSNVSTIVSADSNDCLTNGGSTANSAPITQYACNGSPNQGWHTVQGSDGYFTIQNAAGFCMTTGGSTANSAPVTQYACNGSDNQQWS